MAAAVVLGSVLTVLEPKYKRFLPSPTGIGLGILIPTFYILPMVAGAILQYAWKKHSPKAEEELSTPLASGLIVGEALLALIIPILFYLGWLSLGSGGSGH